MCDNNMRTFIKEIDWGLVLINLLHGSQNLNFWWRILGRLIDGMGVSMKIGNMTLILLEL